MLEPDATDAAVRHERLALCDHLEGLDDAAWATQSLCSAWTVRDVVAHLTVTTRATVPFVVKAALRARGGFDRMAVQVAEDRSTRFGPTELVAQLRESAASSRRMPGSGPMDPLMDLVVHAQDISRPLGRLHHSPAEVVVASLAYIATNRFLGGPARIAGLALTATDAGWTSGDGPEVRGAAEDLLLVVGGRPAGLAGLTGPGVQVLAGRLSAAG
ncbi:MAG: maleylpyruvate isomerase family mycothiol-dependent enzyme [Pseudonocardia sp.]|nr:maleylpyruvate isomerase family mycothiol-dependent enzyme [Pseudonocardia sp.]